MENIENVKVSSKEWNEAVNFVNELNKKREKEKQELRESYLKQEIYKIGLYNFNSEEIPYYILDNELEEKINLNNYIFVNIVDRNHVKEIKTGKIYPIVNLKKEKENWISSVVDYSCSKEEIGQFALSKNKFLPTKNYSLAELEVYLTDEISVDENILNNIESREKIKMLRK